MAARPFQFSLRELLAWFAVTAVALSLWVSERMSIGLWLVTLAFAFRCVWTHVQAMTPVGSRREMRRARFWRAVWILLPVASCANLVPFLDTYGAYVNGGYELLGWPYPFRVLGDYGWYLHYSPSALACDLAVSAGIAAAAGFALRDGGRWIAIGVARFFRGRSLVRYPGEWKPPDSGS